MSRRKYVVRACASCGEERPISARDLCRTCYSRVYYRANGKVRDAWRYRQDVTAHTGWTPAVRMPRIEINRIAKGSQYWGRVLPPADELRALGDGELLAWGAGHGTIRHNPPARCGSCGHTHLCHRLAWDGDRRIAVSCYVSEWHPTDPVPCDCSGGVLA